MDQFDCVERKFLRRPKVFRVFRRHGRLVFVYLGSVVRIDADRVRGLPGLSAEEMLSRDERNYSMAIADIVKPSLSSAHFLLGRGLFFSFSLADGTKRQYILHQYGDPVASGKFLLETFGKSLETQNLDNETRQLLEPAGPLEANFFDVVARERYEAENPAVAGQNSGPKEDGQPVWSTWRHPRAVAFQFIVFIAVFASIMLRGCHR